MSQWIHTKAVYTASFRSGISSSHLSTIDGHDTALLYWWHTCYGRIGGGSSLQLSRSLETTGETWQFHGQISWVFGSSSRALPNKVEAITNAPAAKNVQELRSFLGLLNYYGKFVRNLSSLLHPLTKKVGMEQGMCDQAFQLAKDQLVSASVLTHYDPMTAYGIGAVISHTYQWETYLFCVSYSNPQRKELHSAGKRSVVSGFWC